MQTTIITVDNFIVSYLEEHLTKITLKDIGKSEGKNYLSG